MPSLEAKIREAVDAVIYQWEGVKPQFAGHITDAVLKVVEAERPTGEVAHTDSAQDSMKSVDDAVPTGEGAGCKLCGERKAVMCRPCSAECTKDVLSWGDPSHLVTKARAACDAYKLLTSHKDGCGCVRCQNIDALREALGEVKDDG